MKSFNISNSFTKTTGVYFYASKRNLSMY